MLIAQARRLYAGDAFAVEVDNTVYALDATTIDLCLSLFPWAKLQKTKSAVRMHTLLNLRGNIPEFIHISNGKMYEINAMELINMKASSIYVMDRGYVDFARFYAMH